MAYRNDDQKSFSLMSTIGGHTTYVVQTTDDGTLRDADDQPRVGYRVDFQARLPGGYGESVTEAILNLAHQLEERAHELRNYAQKAVLQDAKAKAESKAGAG